MSILFLGKKDDQYALQAWEFLKQHYDGELTVKWGRRGEPMDETWAYWDGDYILAYLFPHILPKHLIESAKKAAINFHPGSPDYPGIGCTNFAIYNGAKKYGATCHFIHEKADTGGIIATKEFDIHPTDTVLSLTRRSYVYLHTLFLDVSSNVLNGKDIKPSSIQWGRKPYTRKELNELCMLDLRMSKEEMQRRVKAVRYPGYSGATLLMHGVKFEAEG